MMKAVKYYKNIDTSHPSLQKTVLFFEVFEQWYDYYSRTVSQRTAKQTKIALIRYVLPTIGHVDITQIHPKTLLDIAQHTAKHSTYYARRTIADVIRIFDYAVIVLQLLDFNHVNRITRYLAQHEIKGHRFVDFSDIPKMIKDINNVTGSAQQFKIALLVLIHTALRRSEVAYAKKSEFDFNKKIWTIPPHRMKVSKNGTHLVPLSDSVLTLLEKVYNNKTDYMFPSITKNKPMNAWSLYYIIKKAGWIEHQTTHGFRKIFSTHAHASRKWSIDAIELSLAHQIRGVRGVYNHANMLDERRELMQWYSFSIDEKKIENSIIDLPALSANQSVY